MLCRHAAAGRRKDVSDNSLFAAFQPDKFDNFQDTALPCGPVDALDLEGKGYIFKNRKMRQQREMLEHHSHLVAPNFDEVFGFYLEKVLRPSKMISPVVGSISRDMQRTKVDFPEPERPIMTKISP